MSSLKILIITTIIAMPAACIAITTSSTTPTAPVITQTPLWHCTAKNENNVYWYQYGATQTQAKSAVEKLCRHGKKESCDVFCMPPEVYYRCTATDSPVKPTDVKGVWHWSSYSKQVAINGARDACRHNSQIGGCYVNPDMCVSS